MFCVAAKTVPGLSTGFSILSISTCSASKTKEFSKSSAGNARREHEKRQDKPNQTSAGEQMFTRLTPGPTWLGLMGGVKSETCVNPPHIHDIQEKPYRHSQMLSSAT